MSLRFKIGLGSLFAPLATLLLYLLAKVVVKIWMGYCYDITEEWLTPPPGKKEPAVFVFNHNRPKDSPLLGLVFDRNGRRVHFFGKSEWNTGLRGKVFRGLGFIPLDRKGGEAVRRMVVKTGRHVLTQRRRFWVIRHPWLVFFIEGKTNQCGKDHIHKGRTGFAQVLLRREDGFEESFDQIEGVRLFYGHIEGTLGKKHPFRRKVHVKFREFVVEPEGSRAKLDVRDFRQRILDGEEELEVYRDLTMLNTAAIADLGEKELSPYYATKCVEETAKAKERSAQD